MKRKSALVYVGEWETEEKERTWHESISSWWKGIPKICTDEIILNPKSLQISSLILRHSSQVITGGGGNGVFAFLLCSGLCAWRSRMNYLSESSLWSFCSLASKQKLFNSAVDVCWKPIFDESEIHKVANQPLVFSSWSFYLSFSCINNTVFSCLSICNLHIDVLPLWLTLWVQ